MKNPFPRKPNVYEDERQRLLATAKYHDPTTEEYQKVMARIDQLDRIMNRTSELKKTVIPALGTIGGITGIYALQQFAGTIVPKALEAWASRPSQKHKELD